MELIWNKMAGKRAGRSVLGKMHRHFLSIAPQYRDLRTTDLGPILYITKQLEGLGKVRAAEIGCGSGMYGLKFIEHLGEKCHLFCVDANREMLRHLRDDFIESCITNFTAIHADSLDCIISFNAIHHFSLADFMREASRVLKPNGKLFLYTRLKDQNERTIWGRHFPCFSEKEKRLYQLDELKSAFASDPNLNINTVKFFEHHRVYPLERLMEQARKHHYSTFQFYKKHEFRDALHRFVQNLLAHYSDLDRISWKDQNTLLVAENIQN